MDCPYCLGKKMFVNGCGGKGMKIVNKILSWLPSSKLFHGACSLHDVIYSLVCIEPIEVEYPNGEVVVLSTRKDCDDLWLKEMLKMCEQIWFGKSVMEWAANRNYRLVRRNGEEFFKHQH